MTPTERIKEVRKYAGLTQEKFGEKLGLKQSQIRDIESGKQKVSIYLSEEIEKNFNISSVWLIFGKGNMLALSEIPTSSEPITILKNHIGDREMEIITAFRELSAEKQELFYHKIKVEAIEERLKNQSYPQSVAKYA